MSRDRKGYYMYYTQSCGPLDFTYHQTESKVVEVIGNQNQLSPRPGQSSRKYSFAKHVRGVTVRGQSFIDNNLTIFLLIFFWQNISKSPHFGSVMWGHWIRGLPHKFGGPSVFGGRPPDRPRTIQCHAHWAWQDQPYNEFQSVQSRSTAVWSCFQPSRSVRWFSVSSTGSSL